jgi:hypothetical protein
MGFNLLTTHDVPAGRVMPQPATSEILTDF